MNFNKFARTFIYAALATITLASQAYANSPQKKELVIGTTVGDFADMVLDSIKPQLEAKGYDVTLVEFTDYITPNIALGDGSIDVNCFQHKPYLDSFTANRGLELTPITQVPTGPMGLYSGKKQQLNDITQGDVVGLPNDPTNQARALIMLQDLGWIKLKDGIDVLKASEMDIAENPYELKWALLEAAQLPVSRSDLDFTVINGNYAASSGIPFGTALYLEPNYDFINWVVVRTEDRDKPFVKDIQEAYNSAAFKDYAEATYTDYKFPASWTKN